LSLFSYGQEKLARSLKHPVSPNLAKSLKLIKSV